LEGGVSPLFVRLVVIAISLALVLTGSARAQVTGEQFDNARLERLRELSFKHPVPIIVATPDQAAAIAKAELERDDARKRLAADTCAAAMIGLVPPNFDLKDAVLQRTRTSVGGFYSDELKQIVLIQNGVDGTPVVNNAVPFSSQFDSFGGSRLAHELTHALQDQHFDLKSKEANLEDNGDELFAFDSVVEGDATLVGIAYSHGGDMSDAVADQAVSHTRLEMRKMVAQARAEGLPDALTIPGILTYVDGVAFVADAWRRGGWKAVDALYQDLPLSSQQIMHPAMYFDQRVNPRQISFADYENVMPEWSTVHADTVGELNLRIILTRAFGRNSSRVALERRWSGDRMLILHHNDTVGVVWVITFDTETAASDFVTDSATIFASTPHQLDRHGTAVLAVIGVPAKVPNIPAEFWKCVTIAPLPPRAS
jgi:hypothetical protein